MKRLLGVVTIACLAIASSAPAAFGAFGVRSFDGEFRAFPESSAPATIAGSHPYSLGAKVSFDVEPGEEGRLVPSGRVKNIDAELPAGLIGSATAAPRCAGILAAFGLECPADTQIGVIELILGADGETEQTTPLYNVETPAGVPGLLAFNVQGRASVRIGAYVRPASPGSTEGYGLDLRIDDIPEALPVVSAGVKFFGVPPNGGRRPFTTMPTSCSGEPLTVRAHITSWEGDSTDVSFSPRDQSGAPIKVEGCDRVPFDPRFATGLDSASTDSPSGLSVEVETPQNQNPAAIATANLRKTTVKLPVGVSVNPSAADGLVGCSLAQFDQFGEAPSTCPDASKVGSVAITTSLIPDPVLGGVYLAKQSENPFDSLLALYLIGEGDGIKVKLPGKVDLDPAGGQITATFDQTPQLPFEDLKLHFFDSPRSVLATPVTCETRAVEAALTPWSSVISSARTGTIAVSSGAGGSACPASAAARPFKLGFAAGTASAAAGRHSPLSLEVGRPDGSQELSRIDATLPKGLLATLKGVPECAAANAAAGACPAASQVGSLVAGAGAGTSPLYVKGGHAYLTGPYGGAPLGLDFVVPVVAGPLDLGSVNVRAALFVDPETAQVTVRSDPLPQILDGIPLRLRSVAIGIDRPDFIVNPTSCEPTSVAAQATSTEGASTSLSSPFQATGCRGLAFAPKVTPRLLGGPGALRRGGHPRLRVAIVQKADGANLSTVALTLPKSILLDQGHIRGVCTRVQFAAEDCPKSSVYGHAKVFTPLLDQPLEGPVYLRSSSHTLPDLVFDLHGQIDVVLAGRIDSHRGGIRVSVASIPDAPVSRFVLDMKGGAKGLLQSSVDLCRARKGRAVVRTSGQNGAVADSDPVLGAGCGKARSKAHR